MDEENPTFVILWRFTALPQSFAFNVVTDDPFIVACHYSLQKWIAFLIFYKLLMQMRLIRLASLRLCEIQRSSLLHSQIDADGFSHSISIFGKRLQYFRRLE